MVSKHFERKDMNIEVEGTIDRNVLDSLLAVGGEALGKRLHDQIVADLMRLQEALEPGKPANAVAAHEVKGLAATIGAAQLSSLAENLQGCIEDGKPDERLRATVSAEIAAVLELLTSGKASRADS